MTKERKQFILSLFKSYNENKQTLKFLSSKPLNEMTTAEKKYFDFLKKKIKVVDVALYGFGFQGLNKRDFVVRCFMNGETQKQLSFSCFVSEKTVYRWEQEVFNKVDALLKEEGM